MASASLKAARTKAISKLYDGSRRVEKTFRASLKAGTGGVQNAKYKYLRDRSIARRDARKARIASGNAATVRRLTPFSKATAKKSSKGGSSSSGS